MDSLSGKDRTELTPEQRAFRRRQRGGSVTAAQRAAFLEAFAGCGVVADAAAAAGFTRHTAYRLRWRDEEFAAAWDEVKAEAEQHKLDAIEEYAQKVAAEGWERPVYQKGEIVGSYSQPEPRLMMYMLERRRGRDYGAGSTVDVNVTQVARVELSEEDRALLEPLKRRLLLGKDSSGEVIEGELVADTAAPPASGGDSGGA